MKFQGSWITTKDFIGERCHPWASAPIIAIVEDLATRFPDKLRIVPLE
ncbi:MAG: hypothetical protein LUH56_06290 [Oscillospiraceae bacterium]|nr:hypothetical protein [Oscillospiraceae bacterium]